MKKYIFLLLTSFLLVNTQLYAQQEKRFSTIVIKVDENTQDGFQNAISKINSITNMQREYTCVVSGVIVCRLYHSSLNEQSAREYVLRVLNDKSYRITILYLDMHDLLQVDKC